MHAAHAITFAVQLFEELSTKWIVKVDYRKMQLFTLEKLRLFRQFYILVVCYIYFTRIIVYLVRVMLPCHMAWLARGASELASLAFYLCVGYYFR